jgi:hypothetical protein
MATDRVARIRSAIAFLAICALAAGVGLLCAAKQELIQFRSGVPYDAYAYTEMAYQAALGLPIKTFSPYVYCVGLPFLVGKLFPHDIANFPRDAITGFLTLNLACAVATVPVLGALIRRYVGSYLVLTILLLVWAVHPQGPFRFVAFWPAHTDPPAVLCMAILLLVLARWPGHSLWRTGTLVGVTIVGTLVREIVLLAAAATAVEAFWVARHRGRWNAALLAQAIGPTLASLICVAVVHASVQALGDYTVLNHAVDVLAFKAAHPALVPLALLMMHGPMLALLFVDRGAVLREWVRRQPALVAFVAMVVSGSLIGGNHIDRFLFWTHPVMFPMLAMGLVRAFAGTTRRRVALMLLLVAQVLAFRIGLQIPNSPRDVLADPGHPARWLLAPYGDGANFAQMSAGFMHADSRLPLLLQHAGVLVLLVWLLWPLSGSRRATAVGSGGAAAG